MGHGTVGTSAVGINYGSGTTLARQTVKYICGDKDGLHVWTRMTSLAFGIWGAFALHHFGTNSPLIRSEGALEATLDKMGGGGPGIII